MGELSTVFRFLTLRTRVRSALPVPGRWGRGCRGSEHHVRAAVDHLRVAMTPSPVSTAKTWATAFMKEKCDADTRCRDPLTRGSGKGPQPRAWAVCSASPGTTTSTGSAEFSDSGFDLASACRTPNRSTLPFPGRLLPTADAVLTARSTSSWASGPDSGCARRTAAPPDRRTAGPPHRATLDQVSLGCGRVVNGDQADAFPRSSARDPSSSGGTPSGANSFQAGFAGLGSTIARSARTSSPPVDSAP